MSINGSITEQSLADVRDRETLFGFLNQQLGWPLDPEDSFTYSGPSLPDTTAARVEVSRIVPFTGSDPFVIMLAEFREGFRRSELRQVLRAVKSEMRTRASYQGRSLEDIVFVCATEGYGGVRFARFEERGARQPKLSVFGWDRDQVDETRTLREMNLPALRLARNVLDEPDWPACRQSWQEAWNVERVTREFFRDYRRVFEAVEDMLVACIASQERRRLFAQRLFNRLLFIRFLERKGWLSYHGRTDYLHSLLQAGSAHSGDFYRDRLKLLFFTGLNTRSEADVIGINDGGFLREMIGEVPYLNGGLFEPDDDDRDTSITVPFPAFQMIQTELFERYNFTVTESTPLDVEVAVDPEMLGRVFEELVTGRHDTGSYYTPKAIVSFMCREALKGYLESELPHEEPEAIGRFVDEHDPEDLRRPEDVFAALKSVTACDPACGSGAYLLGMLHELVDLRRCLFATKGLDSPSEHRRKLEIIQNNLYGVDNDQFAVNIARLRLWLSLAVEYEGEDPPPLPNLDFKIEKGDSLTAPDPSGGTQLDWIRQQQIGEFMRLKSDYLNAHGGAKLDLRTRIDQLRSEIAAHAHEGLAVNGFDWQVEFAEVFAPEEPLSTIGGAMNFGQELAERPKPGGFDIVLANPPYVRQELIKEIKPALKRVYGDLYCGTADLYVYFYLRSLQLLRPGGMLAFISSNKWFRANYGQRLRAHIAETCAVRSITDFGSLPVFESATAYPMIFAAQKGATSASCRFTQVESLEEPYPDVRALIEKEGLELPADSIKGSNWILADASSTARMRTMQRSGVPLDEYTRGQIFYGVKTGLNGAFVIDGATRSELIRADQSSVEIIRPFLRGKDIHRWSIESRDLWLIYAPWELDITRYPAVEQHLDRWKRQLLARPECAAGRYNWWCMARYGAEYAGEFGHPKIIFPDIAREMRFTLDTSGSYLANTAYMIPLDDPYLLAVLNSAHVGEFYADVSAQVRGGYLRFFDQYVRRIPIPTPSDSDRSAISALAQMCLDARGEGCEEWEREIDERVAALYGL